MASINIFRLQMDYMFPIRDILMNKIKINHWITLPPVLSDRFCRHSTGRHKSFYLHRWGHPDNAGSTKQSWILLIPGINTTTMGRLETIIFISPTSKMPDILALYIILNYVWWTITICYINITIGSNGSFHRFEWIFFSIDPQFVWCLVCHHHFPIQGGVTTFPILGLQMNRTSSPPASQFVSPWPPGNPCPQECSNLPDLS